MRFGPSGACEPRAWHERGRSVPGADSRSTAPGTAARPVESSGGGRFGRRGRQRGGERVIGRRDIRRPSWVDPSEVERIAREKQEREAIAAEPVAPLPPEQDWRHAGEFIKYSHTATVPFWKVGYASLFIYLALLWLCSPIALIYIWTTEWRTFTKVYRTAVALIFVGALLNYLSRRAGLG